MIVAVIPAKKDSTRLPNKNQLKLKKKSLVTIAIQFARGCELIDEIFVSTDCSRIADEAKTAGANVIFRGPELCGDAPIADVYRHASRQIGEEKITYLVGLQPDNPDRTIVLKDALDYAIAKNIDYLITVNNRGEMNGSVRIFSPKALSDLFSLHVGTYLDNCTNIHTLSDLNVARMNLNNNRHIRVENIKIGVQHPVFVVAEAACNHMCNINYGKKMIDRAVSAGADAVKFQTYKADRLVTSKAPSFWGQDSCSQLEYYKRLDRFGKNEFSELFSYAKDKGIIGFSTPFDEQSALMLNELNMPLFKIASCDINNLSFLRFVARFDKPIILSTGASTPEEIHRAVQTIFEAENDRLILMACTLSYPTRANDANLMRIKSLKETYPSLIIGLSDHTEPDPHMIIPSLAVAMGARVIEKHYTLSRSMTGSGHFFAVDPEDLEKMVKNIRLAETALGDGRLGVMNVEETAWQNARRSIVAKHPIKKNVIIDETMLGFKRPAFGLAPGEKDLIIGKRTKIDIPFDEPIHLYMIE
jgi:sialic acid synthase SpsE/spore coat polysaccharide biosynthesis protein SpsF (cytidylyltransferase family)